MNLTQLFRSGPPKLSFELFPPKTEKGERALYRHMENLCQFDPDFITCTYGAGGSTREKTLEIVSNIKQRFDVPVASHLTVVGSTVDELRAYLTRAERAGVDYIVALRGDPPQGQSRFEAIEGGFQHANELVELIRAEFPDFGIAVAGYPEKHIEAPSSQVDLENLKRKVDTGADIVITQLFFDNSDFLRFRQQCREMQITVPIIPGILPVTSLSQIQRITQLCGAKLPASFVSRLAEHESSQWQFQVGVSQAIEQVQSLIAAGAEGLHFYVLNRSQATTEILKSIPIDAVRAT